MAGVLNRRDLSWKATMGVFDFLSHHMRARLPQEIVDVIYRINHPVVVPRTAPTKVILVGKHPAATPPASGRCMLMELPIELRKIVFAHILPNKDVMIRPLCQQHAQIRNSQRKPRHNTVSDMMVLSKSLKRQIVTSIYEERFFTIHVHEGIHHGGIEFLDAGRQPLHYKADLSDKRFIRFDDGDFGFDRLKKIEIVIHPASEEGRHNAMTTYFNNEALVRMLERGGLEDRIVSLTISFAEPASGVAQAGVTRRQIARGEHAWWDQDSGKPRSTSIYGLSDVELALRPFAMLTTVHAVRIYLPTKVKNHDATVHFAHELERSMKSNIGTLRSNDNLDLHVHTLRDEMDDFIFKSKHGHKAEQVPKITDQDDFEDRWGRDEVEEQFKDGTSNHWDPRGMQVQEDSAWEDYDPAIWGEGPAKTSAYNTSRVNLEDEMDVDAEEMPNQETIFNGAGRTLGGMNVDGSAIQERFVPMGYQRIDTKERTVKKPDGSTRVRTQWTYHPVHGKRTVGRGVSDLEVNNLSISGEDKTAGKHIKRDTSDTPGSFRTEVGEAIASGAESPTLRPIVFDMGALARLRQARLDKLAADRG